MKIKKVVYELTKEEFEAFMTVLNILNEVEEEHYSEISYDELKSVEQTFAGIYRILKSSTRGCELLKQHGYPLDHVCMQESD